jgi:zinc-ribbon domain
MKRCQTCGKENDDSMSFCLDCGTALANAPIIINTQGNSPSQPGGPPTNFNTNRETETFVANRNNYPNTFPQAPQPFVSPATGGGSRPNSKLLPILGGLAALVILLGVAGGAIIYYVYKPGPGPTYSPTPTPSASPSGSPKKSPSPGASPSVSPSVSPSASPQASFTPPTSATRTGSFTVYPNGAWQLSDIDVTSEEEYTTAAAGLIDLGGLKTHVTPAGITDASAKSRRLFADFPTGALLFRTHFADGHVGNIQPVSSAKGKDWVNFKDEIGKLEFCINDNDASSNGGQFTVTVTMKKDPSKK